jgi:hypothetical protein
MKHINLITGQPLTDEEEKRVSDLRKRCPKLTGKDRVEEPDLTDEDIAILERIWDKLDKAH